MATLVARVGRGTAGKLERIRQLAEHGLNTPRLVRIEAGTAFDDSLRDFLRAQADGKELMTVRTYHPSDEVRYAKGPFHPEIPSEEAIRVAEHLVGKWHVLFQEAIDVEETVFAGNVLLDAAGAGAYEVLQGRYRVRDVEHPPPGSSAAHLRGAFSQPSEIRIPAIQDAVERVLRSGLVNDVTGAAIDRIIIELNVQAEPVGELREPLLFWEWRPAGRVTAVTERAEDAREDGGVYGVGVPSMSEPEGASDAPAALGGKGFGLVRMARAELPVPPAVVFAVPHGHVVKDVPREWNDQLEAAISALRRSSHRARASVRSAPTVSMPGMLDTVLDVELSPAAVRDAMETVLGSWWSERALAYRRDQKIERAGLAIIVQAFVDGTHGADSGAGVGFTRDPRSGDRRPVVEYLSGARGDDVVGGQVTPERSDDFEALHGKLWPQLEDVARLLERTFGDMQEFEFTVEAGAFFLLQTRSGKRSPVARVRIAHDLLQEGLVQEARARDLLARIDARRLITRRLAPNSAAPLATARVASPGAISGRLALSRERAVQLAALGESVILCSDTTNPGDYPVMSKLAGLLTRHGGVTSHAAVVALEAGIVALVGCEALEIDRSGGRAIFGQSQVAEGDWISLDGTTGLVYAGRVPDAPGELPVGLTAEVLAWASAAVSGEPAG